MISAQSVDSLSLLRWIGALGLAISAFFFILVAHTRYEQVKHLNDVGAHLSSPSLCVTGSKITSGDNAPVLVSTSNLSVTSSQSVRGDNPPVPVLASSPSISIESSEDVSGDNPSELALHNGTTSGDDILVENPFDMSCAPIPRAHGKSSAARVPAHTDDEDGDHQVSPTRRVSRWNRAGLFFGYTCALGVAAVGAYLLMTIVICCTTSLYRFFIVPWVAQGKSYYI